MARQIQIQAEKALHSPTLKTIVMVENSLKKAGQLVSVAELKRMLPRKVMHQTVLEILDYLQASGKIMIGTKGILWIFEERKKLESMANKGLEI
ncbi:MAG: hypothetical protein KJ955_04315 [Nanoarchaeota archaeon]|nr:hypothetical protein [Nanoarchaeota archaeon]